MSDDLIKIDRERRSNWLSLILDRTAEVVGASAGAALTGGNTVLASVVGGTIAEAIKNVGREIEQRVIAPREQFRLSRGAELIVERIKVKYDQGKVPRDDAFFEPVEDGRSAAEEILEGTLLAVQRDAEEKKLRLYANLVADIAFEPRIGREYANTLLAIVQRSTYRQLSIIAFFGEDTSQYKLLGTAMEELPPTLRPIDFFGFMHEMVDLFHSGLLEDREHIIIGRSDINPQNTLLTRIGRSLYHSTRMQSERSTMAADFEKIATHLRLPIPPSQVVVPDPPS